MQPKNGWFEMSCQLHERQQMTFAWYHVTYHPTYYREDFNWAKIGFYPFLTNFLAKCPYFETGFSKNRVSNVKLNFWNIKLQRTWTQEFFLLEFHLKFFKEFKFQKFFFFFFNLQFAITRLSKNQVSKQGHFLKQFQI